LKAAPAYTETSQLECSRATTANFSLGENKVWKNKANAKVSQIDNLCT
jgi:hypothetical protein